MKVHALPTKISLTRRRFLEATVAGSIPIVFGDFGNVSISTSAQGPCSSQLRWWNQARLSNAVLDHVGSELARVYNAMQSQGRKTASDVRRAAANIRLLFEHFDESQMTGVLERQMRECRQDVLDFVPQEDQLRRTSEHLSAFGVSLPPERIRVMFSLSRERKARVMSELERTGIQGFANGLVESLNRFANNLEQQNSDTMKVRYVRLTQDDAAQHICDGLVLLGTLWGLGCALGCGPCCVAAALLLLFAALLEFVDFC